MRHLVGGAGAINAATVLSFLVQLPSAAGAVIVTMAFVAVADAAAVGVCDSTVARGGAETPDDKTRTDSHVSTTTTTR